MRNCIAGSLAAVLARPSSDRQRLWPVRLERLDDDGNAAAAIAERFPREIAVARILRTNVEVRPTLNDKAALRPAQLVPRYEAP